MPLSKCEIQLIYNDFMKEERLKSKELEYIKHLQADANGDHQVSFEEFYDFFTHVDYGYRKAKKYIHKYSLEDADGKIAVTRDKLKECLIDEKGLAKFEDQRESFEKSFALVDVDTFGDGVMGSLNYREMADFFTVFRFCKDHPPVEESQASSEDGGEEDENKTEE